MLVLSYYRHLVDSELEKFVKLIPNPESGYYIKMINWKWSCQNYVDHNKIDGEWLDEWEYGN